MNRRVYDASMLLALVSGVAGAAMQWGAPVALMVAGVGLATLTAVGVLLTGRR